MIVTCITRIQQITEHFSETIPLEDRITAMNRKHNLRSSEQKRSTTNSPGRTDNEPLATREMGTGGEANVDDGRKGATITGLFEGVMATSPGFCAGAAGAVVAAVVAGATDVDDVLVVNGVGAEVGESELESDVIDVVSVLTIFKIGNALGFTGRIVGGDWMGGVAVVDAAI